MSAGLSDQICAAIAEADFAQLPETTIKAAKYVLLDATGVMLAASGEAAEVNPFVDLARSAGNGPCSILGTSHGVPAASAALANGAMAHALDFEDAFDRVPGHPNASLVPALIALAQAEAPIDGKRFLTALAFGSDLACRMALALRQPMEAGNWYPPPMLGGFGAAAGASKLLGLSAAGIRDALSLMLCQTVMPGEIKYSESTEIRAIREGFPAQAAVQSALLARAGVAGFEQPLEGRAGFYALYALGEYAPADLLYGLGEQFWIEQLTFKMWPSCRGTHPFIEMALNLRQKNSFSPNDIASITVQTDELQRMLVEPLARKQEPQTLIDARFSIPFCTALALVRGKLDLDSFTAEALEDASVLAVAQRVKIEDTPAGSNWQPGSGGALTIQLRDGRFLQAETADALGCPARPLSEAQLVAKFADCAGRAAVPLDKARAEVLAARVLALEECSDVGALFV
jgi:2-methylcitrate dehydratase PrpD